MPRQKQYYEEPEEYYQPTRRLPALQNPRVPRRPARPVYYSSSSSESESCSESDSDSSDSGFDEPPKYRRY